MEYTDSKIEAYVEKHTEAAPPLLHQIYQETYAQVPLPQMLSGHLQGRLLAAFSHMLRPTRILEIGTYTGYSALCLAEGLQPGGILYTIDSNKALEARVKNYFEQAGVANKIRYRIGKALDIIPGLNEVFDLVFIDADKRNYSHYYNLVLERIRPGGFIIVDNVLWSGRVLTAPDQKTDKRTQAIINFNAQVHHDVRVANVLLPIRDGLMILRKQ
ncbi:MAG: O-methyltransferase [Bacteroidota bacterium]